MKNLALLAVLLLAINAYSQEKNKVLNTIFTDIEDFENAFSPQDSLYRGLHIKWAFSRATNASFLAESEQNQQFLSRLNNIPDDKLSRQEYISKQVMILRLENFISSTKYNMHMITLNAEGGFYRRINSALNRLPFDTTQDYQDYLSWLPSYVVWIEDYLKLMQNGINVGVVAPKIVIQNNLKLLESWLVDDFNKNPFYKPLNQIPKSWDQKVSEDLRQKAQEIITKQIIPVYKKIDAFLRVNYIAASPDEPGVMFLTNGKSYYEDRVKYYTTLSMTPDSIHLLGLQEVDRIKKSMFEIIKETKFEGDFEDFLNFLRTDEQFYAKTPQELLNHAAWLSKKAEGQLPKLFNKLYSLPFTVSPVAADIAPTYTAGRYAGGSWKQKRAGAYWVNTYKLESRTLYTLPSLTLHEAVPGHHLQNSLAKEITGIPKFRNNYYISAFGEGWGLYSEFLGEEMGMYTTPYERFGRYTYEMWRACRLVVDTGIHYKGWSREKAFDYMKSNTALSLHEVNTEIDRYIGWPGQAVSYKIGELKIKALRKRAEELLGESFDIREFHYHILKNGSVPLPILEEEINLYINFILENK
jgi:uncharacterized protein (DUF885 family)